MTKIAIPKQLSHLNFDKRGLPIPYIVYIKNGCPYFKVNNHVTVEKCIDEKLCTVCGKKLHKDMWLIGGAKSAFHPRGAFNDGPVHKVCGIYSLRVCPYLSHTNYQATGFDTSSIGLVGINPTQTLERLPFFVFCKIRGYYVESTSALHRFFIPHKPYLEVQYWKDGRIATEAEIKDYLKRVNEDL